MQISSTQQVVKNLSLHKASKNEAPTTETPEFKDPVDTFIYDPSISSRDWVEGGIRAAIVTGTIAMGAALFGGDSTAAGLASGVAVAGGMGGLMSCGLGASMGIDGYIESRRENPGTERSVVSRMATGALGLGAMASTIAVGAGLSGYAAHSFAQGNVLAGIGAGLAYTGFLTGGLIFNNMAHCGRTHPMRLSDIQRRDFGHDVMVKWGSYREPADKAQVSS